MDMNFSEDIRKIFLAGVGAIATTAERSQDMIEKLVTKGELTVDQGKTLNQELKRNFTDTVSQGTQKAKKAATQGAVSVLETIEEMTAKERQMLKDALTKMDEETNEQTDGK